MKNSFFFIILSLVITSFTSCLPAQKVKDKKGNISTTYILVRHAEKILNVRNPDLTEEGQQRAESLAYLLKDVHLDAIYTSDYKRTRQTAMPTAKDKGIDLLLYDAQNLEALLTEVDRKYIGKTVLIVGHSNTTPRLANLLASTEYPDFDERIYDNFFVIEAYGQGKGKVLLLKY